jgi:hypothetical protein
MVRKLLSILVAVNIVYCSIGVQVMHHHCVWCGGDRLEVVEVKPFDDADGACCTSHEDTHQDCRTGGCCEPQLLKLSGGLTGEDGVVLKRTEIILPLDIAFLQQENFEIYAVREIITLWDCRRGPPGLQKSAFRVPMRC